MAVFLARFNFFRIPKKGILVLLYHRIDDKPTGKSIDKFSISLSRFEEQIKYLKSKGFESITPYDIEKIKSNKLYLRKKYVLITFDDGYKDNLDAARVLKKYGFKGLFFISTASIGKKLDGVDMMSFDELKELKKMGMVLGSHSHNHKKLTEMDLDTAKKEIKVSLDILNKIQKIEDFAYPFGNYNESVVEVLKDLRIKRAYIIGQRIFDPENESIFKIPRAIVRKDTNKIDFYLIITRGRSKF
ncbi:polysaccharide deacetylase family protein [Hippea alviniae]|uniref:polysaccharide deacetylase family protein n=1 Tax=Hippea alviniae TaxID=1279027 RepID=UPI00138AF29E|nr:polysaccharide deacetylase family protein [Hippea alviniae]